MNKAKATRIRLLVLLALMGLFIVGVAANLYVPSPADVHPYIPSPRNCYFRIEVSVSGNLFGDFPGWCADLYHTIDPCTWYYNAVLTEEYSTGTWGKINWILNHKAADWKVTQAAIWRALGYSWSEIDDRGGLGLTPAQKSAADSLLASADLNFVPGPGQKVAVYVDPGAGIQKLIFEFVIPSGAPEFDGGIPTVASLTLVSYVLLKRRLKAN